MQIDILKSFKKIFLKDKSNIIYDLIIVCTDRNDGWILGSLRNQIIANASGKILYINMNKFKQEFGNKIPKAKTIFYTHYFFYAKLFYSNKFKNKENLSNARNIVYYTHRNDVVFSFTQLVNAFNHAYKVCFMNSYDRDFCIMQGLDKVRADVVFCGADPEKFKPNPDIQREKNLIGIFTGFYERKNPELILNIIKNTPDKNFILIGRNWQKFEYYEELISCKNLNYIQTNYDEYPNLYNKISLLLSCSILEGGPVPIIEAMMCNIPICSTRTGFAPDLIRDGENGYLFNCYDSLEEIKTKINNAMNIDNSDEKIRKMVLNLSWKNLFERILK